MYLALSLIILKRKIINKNNALIFRTPDNFSLSNKEREQESERDT